MNEEEMMAAEGQGQQVQASPEEMIMQIGQIVEENNAMIKEIGEMIAQAMGGGEAAPAQVDPEAALRDEAMARLAQQG